MDPRGFEQARQEHARWKRLAAAFFRPAPPPTPVQTEAFVARVMGRVRAEAARAPWWMARWLVPALSLGLAMLLLVFSQAPSASALPLDTQLLVDGDAGLAQVIAPDAGGEDALLLPGAAQ